MPTTRGPPPPHLRTLTRTRAPPSRPLRPCLLCPLLLPLASQQGEHRLFVLALACCPLLRHLKDPAALSPGSGESERLQPCIVVFTSGGAPAPQTGGRGPATVAPLLHVLPAPAFGPSAAPVLTLLAAAVLAPLPGRARERSELPWASLGPGLLLSVPARAHLLARLGVVACDVVSKRTACSLSRSLCSSVFLSLQAAEYLWLGPFGVYCPEQSHSCF